MDGGLLGTKWWQNSNSQHPTWITSGVDSLVLTELISGKAVAWAKILLSDVSILAFLL